MSDNDKVILNPCKKEFIFFWKNGPFTQWYNSQFKGISEYDNNHIEYTFINAEQWMMFNKALLFNDNSIAIQIMNTTKPRTIKSLGRKVSNFSEKIWKKERVKIVFKGNELKFSQNNDIKEHLFNTYPATLVEASPQDKIWGIGLKENDQNAKIKKNWKGLNLLGYTLTDVRDYLLEKEGYNI